MQAAPFPPLVANGADLDHPPPAPTALRRRMAEVYGVDEANVLPVRGVAHGVEVILRRAAIDGAKTVANEGVAEVLDAARHLRLDVSDGWTAGAGAVFVASPDLAEGRTLSVAAMRGRVTEAAPAYFVLDERLIEFSDALSAAPLVRETDNLIILRSLELAYGLAGAPCAALIAKPDLVERLAGVCDPSPLPTPVLRLAEAALDPARAVAQAGRVAELKAERERLFEALHSAPGVSEARNSDGPFLFITPADVQAAHERVRSLAVAGVWREPDRVHIADCLSPENISGYMRAADVILVPSLQEGLPNVAMEASACARPVFGSNVGGIPEVIVHEETGVLLPAGDVSAWESALIRYARQPSLLKRMGERARLRMEALYDCNHYAPQILDLYHEALHQPLSVA